MSVRDLSQDKWVKFGFWTLLYLAWVIWLGNFWFLFGEIVVFDLFISRKVHWAFWKKRYKEGEKRSAWNDWLDAAVFAVIVVTFVNMFFVQAFEIPSSSMESTLYTGDHLFVNKLAYGPRLPQTPLTIPFTHNTIFGGESYSTAIQNDYRRLKGFGSVERGDIVVFNFPHGDSVLTRVPAADYYALCRVYGRDETIKRFGPVIARPMDKTDHYVKRCVAVAGDTLEIRDGEVWVNSEKAPRYEGVQYTYQVVTTGGKLSSDVVEESRLNIREMDATFSRAIPGYDALDLTDRARELVQAQKNVLSVTPNIYGSDVYERDVFPFSTDTLYRWNRDQYGKLWIPKKGATVSLTLQNLPLYSRIISVYEHNSLKVDRDGRILVKPEGAADFEEVHEYTFKQDYYFMMGDNRHNSLDSRYWGFVPEDHIVGKPLMIWLSTDQDRKFPRNIRWSRFFKFV